MHRCVGDVQILMQMHMAMVMYAPTDKLTLSVMVPYVWKEMNNITATGGGFVELD